MTVFSINNWHKNFENNRSRDIKNPAWVAMPNRHDGLGFRTLIGRPNGMALYGVWCVLVQVASKSSPRGFLMRDNCHPHTPGSLSMKTGVPEALILECLEVLQDPEIDWISPQEYAAQAHPPAPLPQPIALLPHPAAVAPQDGAASPHPAAVAPQDGAPRARAERTNELQGLEVVSSLVGGGDFPKTAAAVCSRFPTANAPLITQIVEASVRMYLSVSRPKIPEPSDEVFAAAVEVAASESKRKQTSAALFITTVPTVISNWARYGHESPAATKKPPSIDPSKIIPYDPLSFQKKLQAVQA